MVARHAGPDEGIWYITYELFNIRAANSHLTKLGLLVVSEIRNRPWQRVGIPFSERRAHTYISHCTLKTKKVDCDRVLAYCKRIDQCATFQLRPSFAWVYTLLASWITTRSRERSREQIICHYCAIQDMEPQKTCSECT